MMVAHVLGVGRRAASRCEAEPYRIVGACLLAGLIGLVGGCGRGAAPVESLRAPAVPGPAREHVVGKGETVYAIAWRHSVDYRALARFNSIRDPYTIYPGQVIRIPDDDDVIPPAADPITPAIKSRTETETETDGPKGATTRRITPQPAPVTLPLPDPAPAARPQPRAAPEKPSAQRPSAPAPAPKPARVRTAQVAAPLPVRQVAGLQWSWPTQGATVGSFAGTGKGLDIAGTFEQPVRAAARGRVVYAGGGLVGYGQLIIVKHDNRLLSAYGHNERLLAKEGDTVTGGQHIADMGRSGKGRTTLHFEIRRDGKPVDPVRFLP